MQRKPPLSKELTGKLDPLLRTSGENERSGKVEAAIVLGLEAWTLLPEPKEEWDFYPQIIARGMVRKYVLANDAAKAREWIDTTYRVYFDPERDDGFVNMLEGAAYYDLGLNDQAYAVFEKIYQNKGREWFGQESISYLEFYLKERARRRG